MHNVVDFSFGKNSFDNLGIGRGVRYPGWGEDILARASSSLGVSYPGGYTATPASAWLSLADLNFEVFMFLLASNFVCGL